MAFSMNKNQIYISIQNFIYEKKKIISDYILALLDQRIKCKPLYYIEKQPTRYWSFNYYWSLINIEVI